MTRVHLPVTQIDAAHRTTALEADGAHYGRGPDRDSHAHAQARHHRRRVSRQRDRYLAHLRGVPPRGRPPGSTWDRVPGCDEPGRKEAVVGDARLVYRPDDAQYDDVMAHIGPLEAGETKPVWPWPETRFETSASD